MTEEHAYQIEEVNSDQGKYFESFHRWSSSKKEWQIICGSYRDDYPSAAEQASTHASMHELLLETTQANS